MVEFNEKESLIEFVFDYIQNHTFVGKRIVSGMYIDRYNLKNDNLYGNTCSDRKELLKRIKHKIISFFSILKHLGIIEDYNKNTVQVINRNLMNEIGLNKLLEYKITRKRVD